MGGFGGDGGRVEQRTAGGITAICHFILQSTWLLFYEPASSQPLGGVLLAVAPSGSTAPPVCVAGKL